MYQIYDNILSEITFLIMTNIPLPEREGTNPVAVFIYLIVFAGIFVYPGYVNGFTVPAYRWVMIAPLLGHLIPAFFFSLIGIMTSRSKMSFIYALCSIVVAYILMALAHQLGFSI